MVLSRLLFAALLFFASCSTPASLVQSYIPAHPEADSGITFLVFNAFQKDSLTPLKITHYKTYFAAGTLKKNELPSFSENTTHILQMQSANNAPVLDLFLTNPMLSVEESFNETGRIESHRIFSTDKTLSFRFPSVKGSFDHAILYTKDSMGVFVQSQFVILNP